MPPQINRNNRVSATPKKKSSLGLGSLLGGGLTGGGYTPAVDADALALTQFNGMGIDPTNEDASIDAYNAVRAQQTASGVQSSPARFARYEVGSPVMDRLFNRGANSQQAMALNAGQDAMQFQQDAAARAAQDAARAMMEREVYSNDRTDSRVKLTGDENIRFADRTHDLGILGGDKLSASADPTQFDAVRSRIAGNDLGNRENIQQEPWYYDEQANATRAMLQKQAVENNANSRVVAQPNTRVFSTAMTPQTVGMQYEYPGVRENTREIPTEITLPNGQKMQTGQMHKETSITSTPGGYESDIAAQLQAKRDAAIKLGEAMRNQATSPQPSRVSATPAAAPFTPNNPLTDDMLDILLQKIIRKLPSMDTPKAYSPNYMNMGGR
jgi:hypothetical protein